MMRLSAQNAAELVQTIMRLDRAARCTTFEALVLDLDDRGPGAALTFNNKLNVLFLADAGEGRHNKTPLVFDKGLIISMAKVLIEGTLSVMGLKFWPDG